VIDHHSLQSKTVCTTGPVFIDIRPWGSACSILAFDFFANRRVPSKPVAGMLLSGILSDTLNLKGPTTTQADRVMVAALAQVARVEDINELARMQFRAKSSEVGGYTCTYTCTYTCCAGRWAAHEGARRKRRCCCCCCCLLLLLRGQVTVRRAGGGVRERGVHSCRRRPCCSAAP
jgi:hypothetical protein